MKNSPALDSVLAPLAPVFRRQIDILLDLRENALHAKNASACIASYFDLLQTVPPSSRQELRSLKTWLEENIHILARDAQGNPLETLPLSLHGTNLDNYCQSIITDFQEDRVYQTPAISITFLYKD